MGSNVICGVLRSSFRFKTAVLLRRPDVSNEHIFDGTIIKPFTYFFWYPNVRNSTSHVLLSTVWLLTAPQFL